MQCQGQTEPTKVFRATTELCRILYGSVSVTEDGDCLVGMAVNYARK